MKQHAICIPGIFTITVFFIFLAYYIEPWLLDTYQPNLPVELTMDQWLSSFQMWAYVCVGAAMIASLLWYLLAQNVFKTNYEKPSGKRGMWGFLFVLPAIAIIFSILFIDQAESSLWLAYLCFVVNGLVPYYLATVLFSPTSVKYTPIGSMQIRFW